MLIHNTIKCALVIAAITAAYMQALPTSKFLIVRSGASGHRLVGVNMRVHSMQEVTSVTDTLFDAATGDTARRFDAWVELPKDLLGTGEKQYKSFAYQFLKRVTLLKYTELQKTGENKITEIISLPSPEQYKTVLTPLSKAIGFTLGTAATLAYRNRDALRKKFSKKPAQLQDAATEEELAVE